MNAKRLFRGFVTTLIMTVLFAGTAFAEFSAETETVPNTIGISQWPKDSYLKTGNELNAAFRTLGNKGSYDDYAFSKNIIGIKYEDSISEQDRADAIEIQSSGEPVYAWYDKVDQCIHIHSNAETIFLNRDCSWLTYEMEALVNLSAFSHFDASQVENLNNAFSNNYCSEPISLEPFSEWKTSSLKDMTGAFGGLYFTDVKALAGWDVSHVTNMGSLFQGCTHLKSLDGLENWETENVTLMGSMFLNCSELSDVSALESWDVSNVTHMSNMFQGCYALKDITPISNWKISSLQEAYYMFNSSGVEDASCLNKWDVSSIGNIDNTFSAAFSSSVLGDKYNADGHPIEGFPDWYLNEVAFMSDTSRHAAVKYPKGFVFWETMLPEEPTKDGFVFKGWNTSASGDGDALTFTSGLCYNPAETYYSLWEEKQDTVLKNGAALNVVFKRLGGTITSVQGAKDNYVKAIRHALSMPEDGVETQEIQQSGEVVLAWFDSDTGTIYWYSEADTVYANADMDYICYRFDELYDVTGLGDWDTSKVTSLVAAFCECKKLQNIDGLSSWETSAVTNMSSLFSDCAVLADIQALSSWKTGSVTSLYRAFTGCYCIQNVDALVDWDTSQVTSLQTTFASCRALSDVNGLRYWNTRKVNISDAAFRDCSSLTDATALNGWVISKTDTGNTTFSPAFAFSGITDPSKYPTWYYLYEPAASASALTLDGNGGTVFGEPVITITPETESEANTEPESLSAEYGIDSVMLDGEMILPDIVLLDDDAYGELEKDVMVASPSVATPSVASASDALRDNILVLPEAEREGYTFLGWSDEEDGEVVYEAGDEIVIDGEMVLYAVWAEEPVVATPSNASRSDEPGDKGAASDPDVTEATPSEASRAKEDEEEIPSSRPDPEPEPEPASIEAATPSEPKRETDASESDPADGEPIESNNTNE